MIVKWKFQDFGYTEKIEQQLTIKKVAVYVKNSLRVVECDNLNSKLCDSVSCKLYSEGVGHFVVGVCYHSQKADESELLECIKLACETNHLGDFNYPDINWNTLQTNKNGQKFLNMVMDCYLEQHVCLQPGLIIYWI